MLALDEVATKISRLQACTTWRGVLDLRDRLAQRMAGQLDRGYAHRVFSETKWLVATLGWVKPCPAHPETSRLARRLAVNLAEIIGVEDEIASERLGERVQWEGMSNA